MARSVWKGPFVDGYLLKKAETSRASGRNEVIKTWSRRSTIIPQFVGLTFGVYNGHKFLPVLVTENMIGHKFGEFSPTRIFHGHTAATRRRRRSRSRMGKPKQPRRRGRQRGPGRRAPAAHQPAQAQPGGRADPRQGRRQGAGRADLLAAPHRRPGEEGAAGGDRQCREQPSARRRPALRRGGDGRARHGHEALSRPRPRPRRPHREAVGAI